MKVAVVTAFPSDPAAPRGGVEAVSVNLTRGLAALPDLDVHVVTQDAACQEPVLTTWEGATIHRLPRPRASTLWNAIGPGRRQMHEYLRRLTPDVIHSHDVYGLMVKGLHIPRVFTVHGFIHADTLVGQQRFAWLRSNAWRRVEVDGWAEQPHIISISPYVRERLTGLTEAVIYDIDNPIAPHFFEVVRDERPGTVFSAALISPRKNTLALVQALTLLLESGVEASLRLAGQVADFRYADRIQSLISRSGIERHVCFLGRISTEEVTMELARASVFALVSLEENSPMGIEEAMAAGVPVVASNRCGMPYMIDDERNGFLVNPLEPTDIADGLRRCISGGDNLALGCSARTAAQRRFHPTVVAERTRRVYARAARTGSACYRG